MKVRFPLPTWYTCPSLPAGNGAAGSDGGAAGCDNVTSYNPGVDPMPRRIAALMSTPPRRPSTANNPKNTTNPITMLSSVHNTDDPTSPLLANDAVAVVVAAVVAAPLPNQDELSVAGSIESLERWVGNPNPESLGSPKAPPP